MILPKCIGHSGGKVIKNPKEKYREEKQKDDKGFDNPVHHRDPNYIFFNQQPKGNERYLEEENLQAKDYDIFPLSHLYACNSTHDGGQKIHTGLL